MTPAARPWLAVAAVLAVAALGLPFDALLDGAQHPARALVAAAVVLAVLGVRSGRRPLLTGAVAAAVAGALLGGPAPTAGRLVLLAAAVCLGVGLHREGLLALSGGRARSGG